MFRVFCAKLCPSHYTAQTAARHSSHPLFFHSSAHARSYLVHLFKTPLFVYCASRCMHPSEHTWCLTLPLCPLRCSPGVCVSALSWHLETSLMGKKTELQTEDLQTGTGTSLLVPCGSGPDCPLRALLAR